MARPALIIGLGGTGQWVLTYVKKELLDYTRGEGIPKEVRLVAFDTIPQIDEMRSKPYEEDPIVVEGVRLESEEFHHLGGNIEKIVREIAEENLHPHISSWLQAKTYLTRLSPGAYLLKEGAGQMRPFGRMAVFKDLESSPENSKIFNALRAAIQEIRRSVKENRSLEIIIVASLAGGTGAGTAIDIAHMVKTIAEDTIGIRNYVIRGFFVLPRTFHLIPGGDTQSMRARAFAALRELSRFITVFGDREYPMIYSFDTEYTHLLQKPIRRRLFDLCYLVDARRERNSLDDIEPKFGVFPSIADALLTLLDEKSGQEYTEHVNNMMPHLTKGDDVAYFSAIGTYSFVLPTREIAEEHACKLAIDFLKRLVSPELDEQGRAIGLSSDKNLEIPNKRGSDLVDNFMKEPASVEGMSGTLFLSQAAKLLEQGGIRNNQLLEQVAARSNLEWLTFMEPDDATEEIRDLRTEVRTLFEHWLSKDVKTSREIKGKPEFDYERIEKEVEQYMVKYLGRKQPDGSTTGGRFREGLDRYASLGIEGFQKALGQYCIQLLNGTSDTEPELSKSGKLGFVQEFLDELSRQIELFCRFLERVREIRLRDGRLPLKREEVHQARSQMFEDRKKTGFFNNRADASQKQFLMLMEEQVELEKDEMAFNYVSQTALQYRDHSLSLKGAIDDWVKALALGTAEQASLHEALNKNLEMVKAKRMRRNNFARVRREETDDEYGQSIYKRFSKRELPNLFRCVKWKLNEDDKTVELEVVGEELLCRKTREQDRPIEHNLGIILEKTRGVFQRLLLEESISSRLMNRYDEEYLANQFYENSSPLVSFSSAPGFGQSCIFLAVKHGIFEGDEPYFRDVVDKISDRTGAKGQQAKLVQSDNTHKCTLLYSIDVINLDSIDAYNELLFAYNNFEDDRRLLHVFPAEVNAVYYEQLVQNKLNKKYRLFNPRITFVLEYKDWVRQFLRCIVYDLINPDNDEEGRQFLNLHLPGCKHKGKQYNAEIIELTPHVAKRADFHHAMYTFVFKRKDDRSGFESAIHYDHVVKSLILAEKEVGNVDANIKKIRTFIGSDFINDLKNSDSQYERDLGDLMHVMLLEEIDRFGIGPTGQEKDEPADQEIETYHMALLVSPKKITVGQRLTLRVEIRPGALEKNSFQLSKDIRELYCFVNADGLQLVGDEAAAIPRDPNTGQPVPVEFELQGHVRGKQSFTVELFIEDHESKRLRIIKSGSQVTVAAPKPTQEPQPILPQIDIRVAPQPDFLLQVESNVHAETAKRHYPLKLVYRLTSFLSEARCNQEIVGEVLLDSTELVHFRTMLNHTLGQIDNAQPQDVRRRMLSLGTYLFDRLFPLDTAEKFHTMFWKVRNKITTWLVVEDVIKNGINWIPWELVVPHGKGEDSPPLFLGEQYHLSRWVNGLGTTLYGECPFGDIALIDYKHLIVPGGEEQSERMAWQRLLNAHKAKQLREVIQPETPVYAVHVLRYADQVTRREIVDRDQTDRTGEIYPEEEAQQRARLDLKLKRPIVTFGILNQNSILSTTPLNDVSLPDRVLPFLRAGASAVICPWWPTSEVADQIFWNTFYDLLGRSVPLGEAVLRARLSVKHTFPHLADWLAYSLFGDPRARFYWPEDSQGYTALECLESVKYLRPGKTYSFRASISAFPPVGFKGRLVRPSALPDEVQALFLAPGLQETIPGPVPMVPVNPGGTVREAIQQFKAPQFPGKYPLLVQFFADEEHIKTLKLMLNVDYD